MHTTDPAPAAIRYGTAAAVTTYVERRFNRSCRSKSATGVSCARPPCAKPPTRLTTARNGADGSLGLLASAVGAPFTGQLRWIAGVPLT